MEPGVEWIETNTGYAFLDWALPISQCAVVLIDVWNYHYLKDTMARSEKIVREKIEPLVKACRASGLQLIHAPGPGLAERYPQWIGDKFRVQRTLSKENWPPMEFLGRSGPYAIYGKPLESRQGELDALGKTRIIHPLITPVDGDVVIATGDELHGYCKEKGILFLFFLGFNTNACILMRDYGTLEMGKRGYGIIVIRDCTTGMESFETQAKLSQTQGAILFLEMFGSYSVTSEEIMGGLREGKGTK